MIDKSVEFKYKEDDEEDKNKNNYYFSELLIGIIFSIFLIINWFSLKWLHDYQYIFTIHRYINLYFSVYFPFQISSYFLSIISLFINIVITITCNYFILKIIINIANQEHNESFSELPKFIFIPIILNIFLLFLGKLSFNYYSLRLYFYYIGICIDLISLFSLLKLNLDKMIDNDYFKIIYESEFIKFIFEDCFFEILLVIDLYYCFYVICQIFNYFISNLNIDNFLGIMANIFFGIISLYIIFKFKNFVIPIFIALIFFGFIDFQFTIKKEEKEEKHLGYEELFLSIFFSFCIIIEIIFIALYKYQN